MADDTPIQTSGAHVADTEATTKQTPTSKTETVESAPISNAAVQTTEERRSALEAAKTKLRDAIDRDNIRRDLLAEEEDEAALSDVRSNTRLSDPDNQSRLEALIDFRAYNDVQYYKEKLKKENIFTAQEQEEILQVAQDVQNPAKYIEQDTELKDKLTDLMESETISKEDADRYAHLKDSYLKKRPPVVKPITPKGKGGTSPETPSGPEGERGDKKGKEKPEKTNSKLLALKIETAKRDLEVLQELIGKETDSEMLKLLQEQEKRLTSELKELEEMKVKLDGPAKGEEAQKAEKEKEEEKGKEGAKGKGKTVAGNVGSGNSGTDGLSGALSGMNPQGGAGNMPVTAKGKPDDAAIQRLMSEAQPVEEQKSWWERNKTWLLWTLSALALGTVAFLGFRKGGWWNKDKKENTTTTTTPATNTTEGNTTSPTVNPENTNTATGNVSTLENSATKVNTDTVEQLNNALTNNSRSL